MIEKRIRGGIYHSTRRYVKDDIKHTKGYDKNKESLYLKYSDIK